MEAAGVWDERQAWEAPGARGLGDRDQGQGWGWGYVAWPKPAFLNRLR